VKVMDHGPLMVRSGSWTREVERKLRLVWLHAYYSDIPPSPALCLNNDLQDLVAFLFDW
jgi:hypothetical protein